MVAPVRRGFSECFVDRQACLQCGLFCGGLWLERYSGRERGAHACDRGLGSFRLSSKAEDFGFELVGWEARVICLGQ